MRQEKTDILLRIEIVLLILTAIISYSAYLSIIWPEYSSDPNMRYEQNRHGAIIGSVLFGLIIPLGPFGLVRWCSQNLGSFKRNKTILFVVSLIFYSGMIFENISWASFYYETNKPHGMGRDIEMIIVPLVIGGIGFLFMLLGWLLSFVYQQESSDW